MAFALYTVIILYIILIIHIGIYIAIPLFPRALKYTLRYEVPKIFAAFPAIALGLLTLVATAIAASLAWVLLFCALFTLMSIWSIVLYMISKM